MTPLTPFGIWVYVGIAAIVAVISFGATHEIDALAYGHTIDGLKLDAKTKEAADITQSLSTLQTFITGMHTADVNYNAALDTLKGNLIAIEAEFKHATQKPLPLDCKPDADRVRTLSDAVHAIAPAASSP